MLTKLLENARTTLPSNFNPFPTASNRNFWDNVPKDFTKIFIVEAENHLNSDFPVLKATTFMEYYRNGNRTGYQKVYGKRRNALNVVILAELFENKGRFIDLLADLVWMFCEQTTWIIPAHNAIGGYKHFALPLPDYDNPIVALMSADVAASLALAYYFFKDKFDEITPQINTRVKTELHKRILKPYRNHTDYWWMGFMHVGNEQLNNWNPWINSNVLMVLLILEDNQAERYFQLHKMVESLDKYLESYPDDGGCDEGPGYWGRAGASFFECLDILFDFSNGAIDIYNHPKVLNMCRYIYRAHIDGPYFVNFADAGPKALTNPPLIYRFGKSVNDKKSMAFASYLYKNVENNDVIGRFGIIRVLHEVKVMDEIKSFDIEFIPEPSVFLPDIEVAFLRAANEKGEIYIAVKGGNNFENHNHNDIGNFVVYGNGEPFIIDAGSMEYTKKTFSPERYEIWSNCSLWHNTPEVNRAKQLCGREYKASNTSFTDSDGIAAFTTELQNAYPKTSGIKKWERTVSLDSVSATVIINDIFDLEYTTDDIRLNLMSLPKPKINGNRIILSKDKTNLEISFSEDFDAEFETMLLDDANLRNSWGEKLYRISLNIKKSVSAGSCRMMFRLI